MLKNKFSMRLIFAAAMLTFLAMASMQAFCQSPDGSLIGTIKDPTQKVVTEANVTLKNTKTDVELKTKSNDTGRYSFLGLQSGSYLLTIEKQGFALYEKDIKISTASQIVEDVKLKVGERTGDKVVVTGTSLQQDIVAEGTNVVQVIDQKYLQELPIMTNNAIDMVGMLGGVVMAPGSAAYQDQSSNLMIMGTPASGVQVIRDGINVNEVRWNSGIQTPSHVNPDVVEEFKVVLSPADAEYGRGGPQIIMNTRTGTSQYRGAINFN